MKRNELVAVFVLFLAPFLFYFPVTLGQKIFFDGDISLFYYPLRVALARALADNHLPLWSPGMMMGFPLIAEGQIGAFYPLNQLLYRILPAWRALGLEMLFHLGWMSVGMFCFARQIKLSVPGAFLASIVFASNAYIMANLLYPSVLATMAWMPWSIWLLEKALAASLVRARALWWGCLCVGVALQVFSAHPYHEFFSMMLLCVYALFWQWRKHEAINFRWQPVGLVISAILVALGMGAVQLLPTLELSQISNRAQLTFDEFTIYSVEWQHLLLLIAPFAQGGVYGVPGGVLAYFGILPLLLAALAPLLYRNREVLFWTGLALMGLALAFGRNNPLYGLLYALPIFNSFRLADRFLYVFEFGVAVLAALAFDRMSARVSPGAHHFKWLLGLMGVGLGIEILAVYQGTLQNWQTLWNGLPILWICVSLILLIGVYRRRLNREIFLVTVIGLTLFDLTAFDAVFIHSKNALVSIEEFLRAPFSLAMVQSDPGKARVLTAGSLIPPFSVAQASFFPYWGTVYGVQGVKGATSFTIQRVRDYTNTFSPGMLNLANVQYLAIPIFPPAENGTVVSQPSDKFALRLGTDRIDLSPTHASAFEIDSYIDQADLKDNTRVGGITVYFDDGTTATLPLRVGIETANWAMGQNSGRMMPPIASTIATNSNKQAHTFRVRINVPAEHALVGFQLTPDSRVDILRVEHIRLIDSQGNATLLDYQLGASNHSTIYRDDLVTVIENADVMPRAFLMHAAQAANDADTLKRLRDYTFDPNQILWLADGNPLASDSPEQDDDESVQITAYEPERVRLTVMANRPAYLVLTDTWYPGWLAQVDGKPAPIYRADYIFRAVPIEPGRHTVEFNFRSAVFERGATISIITLVLSILGLGWIFFRK